MAALDVLSSIFTATWGLFTGVEVPGLGISFADWFLAIVLIGVAVKAVSYAFGFGSGGGTYGQTSERFGGGGGAGVKIDPVAFLVIKDGQTRMVPVAVPATATMDRVLEMAPQLIDRVEGFVNKKKEEKEFV